MGKLGDFEDSIGRSIEGAFGKMFRSPVQPAELARACSKEMDRSKKLGVGKVYVANLYSILVSTADARELIPMKDMLSNELEAYLLAHARENDYQMVTKPIVRLLSERQLKLGKFEVIAETMSKAELATELGDSYPSEQPAASHASPQDDPYRDPFDDAVAAIPVEPARFAPTPPAHPVTPASSPPIAPTSVYPAVGALTSNDAPPTSRLLARPKVSLCVSGEGTYCLGDKDSYMIGRSDGCDIVVVDSSVSRRHALIEREGAGWRVTDNGATNPTHLNNQPVSSQRLCDGDVITVGTTLITYHEDYKDGARV